MMLQLVVLPLTEGAVRPAQDVEIQKGNFAPAESAFVFPRTFKIILTRYQSRSSSPISIS
jgi:hypothetical protein